MKNATILSLLLLCAVIRHCNCLPSKEKDVKIRAELTRLLRHLTKTNSDEHPLKKDFGTAGHSMMTSNERSARGPFGCSSNEFRCSNRGKCIPAAWVCDGDSDCPNNADEQNCADSTSQPGCGSDQFQCPNGRCISAKWVCDGDNDCEDNADEQDCAAPASPPGSCGTPAFEPSVSLSRIVGGDEARKHSWPWQCLINGKLGRSLTGYQSQCGGSVIGDRYILTASHCLYYQDELGDRLIYRIEDHEFTVMCGLHNKKDRWDPAVQKFTGITTVEHENYKRYDTDFDIAIIKLPTALKYNDYVQPICLPSSPVAVGTNCVVTGWGKTLGTGEESVLRQAVVPIVSNDVCKAKLLQASPPLTVTENNICAGYMEGGRDSCQGDSGGPLVCKQGDKWLQYGVVSFGEGCALPNFPGVYADVVHFLPWIEQKSGIGASALKT